MDVRQLRYFVQIIDSGSLAKAARQLFIVQPALSLQMARLEAEIGKPLLQRHSRGVKPTENGMALYHHAVFMLRQMEQSLAVARQEATALSGRVVLGLAPSTVCQLGAALLESVRQRYPSVSLNIVEGLSGHLEYMTHVGQLDLAVLFRPDVASDQEVAFLYDEELFVIGAPHTRHLAPGQTTLTLREAAALPLILPSLRHALRRRRIELEFERHGLRLAPVMEIDSLSLLMNWVRRDEGVTIQPHAAVHALGGGPGDWRCTRIADVRVCRPNYLYTLPSTRLSPAATAVRDELRRVIQAQLDAGDWQGVSLLAERP